LRCGFAGECDRGHVLASALPSRQQRHHSHCQAGRLASSRRRFHKERSVKLRGNRYALFLVGLTTH